MAHAGQAEVDESRLAVRTDQDIPRFDVLVDDSPGMEVCDGAGQLRDEPRRLSGPRTSLVDELIQGQPLDVFHDDEGPALMKIEIDRADQVGVIARVQRPALANQAVAFRRTRRDRAPGQLEDEGRS